MFRRTPVFISLLHISLFILFISNLSAQQNLLRNASFEDNIPRHSSTPYEWLDCGHEGESEVDIHPDGAFAVKKAAHDGGVYLGMVVRDNETWESISQKLSQALKANDSYNFSVLLARSDTYISMSRLLEKQANYNTPIKLRVWAGNTVCEKAELLVETAAITHTNWKSYEFTFQPKKDYEYFIMEVFYETPTLFPYNGNLLIDALDLRKQFE